MSVEHLEAILPLVILSAGTIAIMLQISVARKINVTFWLTLVFMLLGAMASIPASQSDLGQVTPLLRSDTYSSFFSLLFCLSGAVTAVVSHFYLKNRSGQKEEFYLLLLLSTLGASTLAYASHLASLLLGLELMSIALYALIAYPDDGSLPLEAAIKYLVLSGAASATLLFGFALLYASLGALDYQGIGESLLSNSGNDTVLLAGSAMIIAGAAFKLSATPFHMWTPDVYQGAPTPIAGFLAAVSKGAVFVAILRWFLDSELYLYSTVVDGLALLAGASILIGNLLALKQDNLKRLLAYSSISHIGYLLVVLVACGASTQPALAAEAGSFYLVAYITTTLAAFSLLTYISSHHQEDEPIQRRHLTGLFWRQPLLAVLFAVSLLSLAGIPLTAGFIGKFYIISLSIEAKLWGLLALVVAGSAIAIYYYLRLIFTMSLTDNESHEETQALGGNTFLIYALVLAMLYLGVFPQSLMGFLQSIL